MNELFLFGTFYYFIAPLRSSYSILLHHYNTTSLNPSNPPWPNPVPQQLLMMAGTRQKNNSRPTSIQSAATMYDCSFAQWTSVHRVHPALVTTPSSASWSCHNTARGFQWSRLRTDRASIPEFIVSKSKLWWCKKVKSKHFVFSITWPGNLFLWITLDCTHFNHHHHHQAPQTVLQHCLLSD